ncbi:LacI family DNA-binding transcriptional regulator [Frondihabitans cladoniiphilus]|uniref:LacI family DNA-binding transcriptional regulator n=2 Tax=Frondihabitans cladoniiphilus TaxID=715785 RepID=A0ABP8WBT8_9MICO
MPDPAPASPRAHATLANVAERAGVSLKTASRAVNGERHVAEETRNRVMRAADDLGFQLNGLASLLKRGIRSDFVGLVTGDLANPFYSQLAKGVERELRTAGLTLVVSSSDESGARERALVDELVARQVRALLVVSTLESNASLAAAQQRGIPVVFVDRPPTDLAADSVVLDNRAGAAAAVRHLQRHGHSRIGFIGDFDRLPTHRQRLDGYLDAVEGAGGAGGRDGTETRMLVRENSHDAESARRAATELLGLEDPPTALFTSNNRVTIGALSALREAGLTTALVGFDDFDLADVLGVTVVAHDPVDMGVRAARLALDALAERGALHGGERPAERSGERPGERSAEGSTVRGGGTASLVLPTTLVPRGSGEVPPGTSWRR